jgi:L,D-peptidoglycan transpeptidase YkuD (ErfK/YbiS/YcfS/YnhG family)
MAVSVTRLLLAVIACLCLPAFFGGAAEKDLNVIAEDAAKELRVIEGVFPDSSQVILVTRAGASASDARLWAFEMDEDQWKPVLKPVPAMIGRNGFAPSGEKREGDGRTPPGVYSLGFAFGYGPKIDSAMPYRQMTLSDIWVDDPSSPDYNRLKKRGDTKAKSFEDMVLPDDRYKYGIVIRYNMDPVVPAHGSAIFLHTWKDPKTPTSGCVAISEEGILKLLKWLDPRKRPVILLEKP